MNKTGKALDTNNSGPHLSNYCYLKNFPPANVVARTLNKGVFVEIWWKGNVAFISIREMLYRPICLPVSVVKSFWAIVSVILKLFGRQQFLL